LLNLSFTVGKVDFLKARRILDELKATKFQTMRIVEEGHLAKVSVVGVGMQHHPGVASQMFSLLAQAGINIKLITTSEIKISCLIAEKEVKQAVECLHRGFELHCVE
jgi:aspartate kinase